ncbi:MAG TPA: tyrosine-type recombinase/integrase, partial [Blastocatellia bacterium]|nr:tyrosine-type recombinase/integrase [Blastocatellia bacterium]
RGQGEGSIYKRKDGLWVGAANLGYQNGKLKRKVYYGKTRSEVSEKLTAALRDMQQGVPIVTERQRLQEYLIRWLEDSVKPSVRPSTFVSYEQQVRVHISPELGYIELTKLSPQHIQKYMNGRLESGLSGKTVKYHLSILRMALGQALKWNLVARNVAMLVDPPRLEKFEVQAISLEQARMLIQAVQGDRLEALFTVALSLGLRRGEALGLKWSDIDFQARTLRINHSLQRIQGRLILSEPKTKTSRRVLDLPESLIAKLRETRTRQLEEKLLAGSRWVETGLVFTSSIGTPVDPRHVKRRLDPLLKKAELPHYRVHDLRHFCASLLLAQGVPLKVVSEILGHSQISITADLYTHVLPSVRKEAIDLMDSILTGTK